MKSFKGQLNPKNGLLLDKHVISGPCSQVFALSAVTSPLEHAAFPLPAQLLFPSSCSAAALPAGAWIPRPAPRSLPQAAPGPSATGPPGEHEETRSRRQQKPLAQGQLSSDTGRGKERALHEPSATIQGRVRFWCLGKLPGTAMGQSLRGSLTYRAGEAGGCCRQTSHTAPSENT